MKKSMEKIVGVLVALLLSPVILTGLLCAALCTLWEWLKEPARQREYERSHYYEDFHVPYHKNITNEESYQFYNEIKESNLSVKMIHPSNGGADYLIVRGSVFLFPMNQDVFGGISYNTLECKWKVDFDGELFLLDDEWKKYKHSFVDIEQSLPCYLLLKQCYLNPCHNNEEAFSDNYALDLLPQYVRVVQQYADIVLA